MTPSRADVLDELPRIAPRLRVETRRELVEDGDLRFADQRERDGQALLLAARQLPELGLPLVGEPEVPEQLVAVARVRVERGVEVDGFTDPELILKLTLLKLDADDAPKRVAVVPRLEPEDADRAGIRRSQPADGLDRRRLAGTVGAEDGEDLALLDREGDSVDRRAVAVALDEVGDFDDVHGPSVDPGGRRRHRLKRWNARSTRLMGVSTVRLSARWTFGRGGMDIRPSGHWTDVARSMPGVGRCSTDGRRWADVQGSPAMTPRQVELIRASWTAVEPIADVAATLFYDRLFEQDPAIRRMFRSTDMAAQKKNLMQTLTVVVRSLDHLEQLVPAVQALGRRHGGYGVRPAHYDTVGGALLWTLGQGLGDAFTPEVSEAWAEAYSILATVMIDAAEAAEQSEGAAA